MHIFWTILWSNLSVGFDFPPQPLCCATLSEGREQGYADALTADFISDGDGESDEEEQANAAAEYIRGLGQLPRRHQGGVIL